jgi:hypothetical protein
MQLKYKPDFDAARAAWNYYWAGEKWKRPLVVPVPVPKNAGVKAEFPDKKRYFHVLTGNYRQRFDLIESWLENHVYAAEAIPAFGPDHGPDQFAACLGAALHFSPDSPETSWVEPFVDDWADVLPLKLDEENAVWQSWVKFTRLLAGHARGKYLVRVCDLHANADALSAIRGPDRLCLDFYDCPELVEQAMRDVRRLYQPVYNRLYEAAGYNRAIGTSGWAPFWCEDKFATIQCDFICLVSPETARRYILPALEEEAEFLDHCVFHLDGPGALPHLDGILSIKKIDVIQWVPGAGRPKMWTPEWLDILKRCQKAGKGLQIYDLTIDEAKSVHRQLVPAGLVYCVSASTVGEVEEFCRWLEKNS